MFSFQRVKPICIYANLVKRLYRGVEVEVTADYNFSVYKMIVKKLLKKWH